MKLAQFLFIFVGLMVILNLAGMNLPSGGLVKSTGLVPNSYSDPSVGGGLQNVKNSTFYTSLLAILALAGATAIVASLFSRSAPTSYLKATLVSFIAGIFLADLIAIYQKLVSYNEIWITAGATAIFAPLVIYFFITLIDWWEGGDA